MGPTKNRRRVRPAPQGRAYREQRHFCHVTILLSNDERVMKAGGRGKKSSPAGRPTTAGKGGKAAAGADSVPKRDAAKKAAPPDETKATAAAPEAGAGARTAAGRQHQAE
jgi:hypothetical protein